MVLMWLKKRATGMRIRIANTTGTTTLFLSLKTKQISKMSDTKKITIPKGMNGIQLNALTEVTSME